jgi:hypothetical protein
MVALLNCLKRCCAAKKATRIGRNVGNARRNVTPASHRFIRPQCPRGLRLETHQIYGAAEKVCGNHAIVLLDIRWRHEVYTMPVRKEQDATAFDIERESMRREVRAL